MAAPIEGALGSTRSVGSRRRSTALAVVLAVVTVTAQVGPAAAADSATDDPVAASPTTGAEPTAELGPRPQLCDGILLNDDVETALSVWERSAEGLEGGTMGSVGGESCHHEIFDEPTFFISLEPGDPADFGADAPIDGAPGLPVPGFGTAALLFHAGTDDGTGRTTLAVREERDLGDLHVRLSLGRPDLAPDERGLIVARLMRDILPRFDGEPVPAGPPALVGDVGQLDPDPPDPARLSYVNDLLAKERDGEWTRGEGLAAVLGYFAGERDATVLRHADNSDREGTGILRLAEEYLERGADDGHREEVERLLDQLTFTSDELEMMAGLDPGGGDIALASTRTAQRVDELCSTFVDAIFGDGEPCLELWNDRRARQLRRPLTGSSRRSST